MNRSSLPDLELAISVLQNAIISMLNYVVFMDTNGKTKIYKDNLWIFETLI